MFLGNVYLREEKDLLLTGRSFAKHVILTIVNSKIKIKQKLGHKLQAQKKAVVLVDDCFLGDSVPLTVLKNTSTKIVFWHR